MGGHLCLDNKKKVNGVDVADPLPEFKKNAYAEIRFDAVDVLYLSPFDVRADKTFGYPETPDLWEDHFAWCI